MSGSWQAERRTTFARAAACRLPREHPRAEVGEDVRVGVGPMEFKLNWALARKQSAMFGEDSKDIYLFGRSLCCALCYILRPDRRAKYSDEPDCGSVRKHISKTTRLSFLFKMPMSVDRSFSSGGVVICYAYVLSDLLTTSCFSIIGPMVA